MNEWMNIQMHRLEHVSHVETYQACQQFYILMNKKH